MVSFKALFLSLAVVVPFVVAEGGSVERLGECTVNDDCADILRCITQKQGPYLCGYCKPGGFN
ncbi:hypothetical protein GTA08_BOTSDO00294 [Botryosphaeria dothidea]|uniref:Uncharacterized protein n=1 Tax=Botryosphaeria dothidea TaxID=55169 RepID=A0A8H4J989_9PEZI|nr:hypothetical protein GTA08_BOTSDO00294 [Botryosphaeria dothidea]